MKKINVGIIGGAGYTAGELLRILVHHPNVEITFVHSTSNADKAITSIHHSLFGEIDMTFTDTPLFDQCELLFLCSAHGDSRTFLEKNSEALSLHIIDLSTDYRAKSDSHDFVYGLPELNLDQIKTAKHVANPGCFATAIQLGLLPLAAHRLLTDDIHINAITGSTGAGVKPSATSHFSWRNNNVSIYKPFTHQHLAEIKQSLVQLQPNFDQSLNFLPVRGNFTRGIFMSAYTKTTESLNAMTILYKAFYREAPFVHLTDQNVNLKQIVNTNKAVINLQKHEDKILITIVIDNLLKGAAGQAVQNMNIMYNLDQMTGLRLKSVGF